MRIRFTYEEQLISGETIICGIEDAVVARQSLKPESILFFVPIDPAKEDSQITNNKRF